MKSKTAKIAFEKIRAEVHEWKPISWAGYDDDEPDLDPDDPDYGSAKSMLSDELDGTIKSIVRQLPRVKSESDMAYLLYKAFGELDDRISFGACEVHGSKIFRILEDSSII